ncbi:MAG: hypothetical protein HY815_16905 [Candidatus Riflebacteria bacterium]|nr:hypothetical protein [Candidatus Riflebacteria bacterium]
MTMNRWQVVTAARRLLLWLSIFVAAAVSCEPAAGQGYRGRLSSEEQNVLKAEKYFALAKQATAARRYREAREYLLRITSLRFPRDPQAQYLLAGAYMLLAQIDLGQSQFQTAESSARAALRLCGNRSGVVPAESMRVLGRVAEVQGRRSDSSRYLKRALEMLERQGR